ncbi:hypothetical protein ABW19_dt0204594 [Dactylella cylindrospora]|nr:hypothetical protein ABW19_dt0204594 [Dactylella cylindrospora]
MKFAVVAAALFASVASATLAPVYAQCGGIYHTGPTQCVATATCTYVNAYYSQVCLPMIQYVYNV